MASVIQVVLFVLCINFAFSTKRTVTAPYSGTFTGITETVAIPQSSSSDVRYANVTRFLGVPYAKPPTGNLRFERPEAKDVMTSDYDATINPPLCPQTVGMDSAGAVKWFNVSEDCLYLNIFVPGNSPANLSVLVWIHGGSFKFGGAYFYSGDILSTFGDIIVVVVQYRLNVFGFLSDGSPGSGNMGLWDQSLALKWVQRNIADFGGDPSRITVSGQSAGAASAIYQAMFKQNKGNLQRIIAQSGTPASNLNFALQRSPQTVFQKFAYATNCNTGDMAAAYVCIKGKSMSELLSIAEKIEGLFPVVDGTFIEKDPQNFTKETSSYFRDLDLLVGSTSLDGYSLFQSIGLPGLINSGINVDEGVPKTFFERTFIPMSLGIISNNTASAALIASAISEYSTSSASDDDPVLVRGKMIEFPTDMIFRVPGLIVANAHSAGDSPGRTFAYEFDYTPYFAAIEVRPSWVKGAKHGDEVGFVFGFVDNLKVLLGFPPNFVSPAPVPDKDRALDPNPASTQHEWPEYSSSSGAFFSINQNTTTSDTVQHHLATPSRVNFWEKTVPCFIRLGAEGTCEKCNCDGGGDGTDSAGNIRPIYSLILTVVISCVLWVQ
ncbi:EST2E-like protein [Mya arenaria]|uniref:Carboxylic ester hydrolase n=1 Tax=Mya arenaria TaxID=6604 RepID=A0ABY7ET71_MYAAR|nr:EST2E-like protein [Mya arenaria]